MKLRAISCTLSLALLLSITAMAQKSSPDAKQKESNTAARGGRVDNLPQQAPVPATSDPDYVIGPEDTLNISVWKEPEVSAAVPVRPDGKISLPLVNDIQAAGLTPMQLGKEISAKLEKFITQPQVTVVVTGVNSRRIYLVGQVGRPGSFALLPDMTVLQALSAAGGLGEFANSKKVYILRNVGGKPTRIPFNYKDVLQGLSPEQNIELKPGDTIVVP